MELILHEAASITCVGGMEARLLGTLADFECRNPILCFTMRSNCALDATPCNGKAESAENSIAKFPYYVELNTR